MSDVTIKQLAQVLGMPVDKLLTQLGEAGMKFSDQEQVISSTEKVKLLGFLRRTHGKRDAVAEADDNAPRQITLRRRTVGELKVATPGGRGATGTAKTVNVEVRAKRTYVKRSVIAEEASAEPEREEAVRKLQESQEEREQEERDRTAAEQRRQDDAQQVALDEHKRQESAREEAEAVAAAEVASATSAPTAESASSEPEPEAQPAPVAKPESAAASEESVDGVRRIDQRDLGMILPRIHEPRKREKLVKQVAPPAPAPAPAKAAVSAAAPAPVAGAATAPAAPAADAGRGKVKHARDRGEGAGGKDGAKRFVGGQMHLSEADRARRSSSNKRGRSARGGRDMSRGSSAQHPRR